MNDIGLKAGIRAHLVATEAKAAWRRLVDEEEGEVGSWLIMAAILAAGAVAAGGILEGWFSDKANDIIKN